MHKARKCARQTIGGASDNLFAQAFERLERFFSPVGFTDADHAILADQFDDGPQCIRLVQAVAAADRGIGDRYRSDSHIDDLKVCHLSALVVLEMG